MAKSNTWIWVGLLVLIILLILWNRGTLSCKDNFGQIPGIRSYVGNDGPNYGGIDPIDQYLQQVQIADQDYRNTANKLGCGGVCRETNDYLCSKCVEAAYRRKTGHNYEPSYFADADKEEFCPSCY